MRLELCLLLGWVLQLEQCWAERGDREEAGFWTQFPMSSLRVSSQNSSELSFSLQVEPGGEEELCLFDPLVVRWSTSLIGQHVVNPKAFSIAFSLAAAEGDTAPRRVTAAPIMQQQDDSSVHRREMSSDETSLPYLQCLLDAEHCEVKLHEVRVDSDSVDDSGQPMRKILISFSTATTMPDLYTAQAINELFEFNPRLGGEYGPAVGEWVENNFLRLSVSDKYIEDLLAASAAGKAVISIREKSAMSTTAEQSYNSQRANNNSLTGISNESSGERAEYSGVFKLRFPQKGLYKIFVIHSTRKNVESSVHKVNVKLCGDNVVPSDLNLLTKFDKKSEKKEKKPPRPLLRHTGVIAVSGSHPVLIPHSVLPPLSSNGGSFSISFWIRLLDQAPGKFRAFFYKGNGIDPNRTPSAWLTPTTNRLAIRSSVMGNPDLGADTTLSIPLKQWAHICVVFDNRSSTASGGGYEIVTYLNGQLDISIGYSTEVIPNNSSFQLFKDISHNGPRSFASDIILWDNALDESQVQSIAKTSASSSFDRWTRPVDLALNLIEGITDLNEEDTLNLNTHLTAESGQSEPVSLLEEDIESAFDLLFDSLPAPTTTPSSTIPLDYVLKEISIAVENCYPPHIRLDLYAEAATMGHIESLYHWAMLVGFGSEKSVSTCGIEKFSIDSASRPYNSDVHPMDMVYDKVNENLMHDRGDWEDLHMLPVADQVKSAMALIVAVQAGYSSALVPLSTLLSTGVGLLPLLNDLEGKSLVGKKSRHLLAYVFRFVPLPVSLASSMGDENTCDVDSDIECLPTKYQKGIIIDSQSLLFFPLPLIYRFSKVLRLSTGVSSISTPEMNPLTLKFENSSKHRGKISTLKKAKPVEGYELPLSNSVFSWHNRFAGTPGNDQDDSTLITKLSSGLLFLAALDDHPDAIIALQKRYQNGWGGLEVNLDVSAFYSKVAALTSSEEYYKVGGQPVMENDRINDDTELTVLEGNTGKDDEMVQTYMVQASEGDVGSMLALGEMNYYGTRGLPRNQPRALNYYNQAAELGNVGGMCGAAGMYIKGEGTEKNVTKAVSLYESAASQGSVRALNGLGFFYFFGDDDTPSNHTKAYHYFLTATEQHDGDSDSWFNAGYCIEHGLGTTPDPERAATFYLHAAKNFGHFGSIMAVGNMHYEGRGISRSVKDAVYYLGVANDIGPWMGWLRRGFDQFVQGGKSGLLSYDTDAKHFMRSTLCYLHAGELGGYEVSQSNAAYLMQRKLSQEGKNYLLGSNLLQDFLPVKHLLINSAEQKNSAPPERNLPCNIADRLLLRELAMSTSQGNSNSAYSIGALLLAGHNGGRGINAGYSEYSMGKDLQPEDAFAMVLNKLDKEYTLEKYLPSSYLGEDVSLDKDISRGDLALTSQSIYSATGNAKAAMTWFSKASAMNSALGSFHSGLMYHFGIGGIEPNLLRASRYYSAAIGNTVNPLHPSLKLMAQMLYWMVDGSSSDINGGQNLSWISRSASEVCGWIAEKFLL